MSAPVKQEVLSVSSNSKLNKMSSPDLGYKAGRSPSVKSDHESDVWDRKSAITLISSHTSNKDLNSPEKIKFDAETVTWNSKTALGLITYPSLNLPILLIFDIKVTTKEKKDTVVSSNLRRLVLHEYIEKALGRDAKGVVMHIHNVSQDVPESNGHTESSHNTRSKTRPSNILIIPIIGNATEEKVESIMNKLFHAQNESLSITKTYSKKENKPEESIICRVAGSRAVGKTDAEYVKYMNVIFRHAVRLSDPAYLDKESVIVETLKGNLPYPYSVGVRAKVESSQNPPPSLAFDLVPVIDANINVLKLVKSQYVLRSTAGLDKKVRDFLRGLHVKIVGRGNSDRSTRIRDVKSSAEVGPIPFAEEEQPLTMKQYLRKHQQNYIDDGQQLLLANIGTHKPFWVTLESLTIVANQPVRGMGHLTPKLQLFRQEIQSKTKLKNWMFPYGTRFLKPLSELGLLDSDSINELRNLEITQYVPVAVKPNPPVTKKEFITDEPLEASSIGIIYIGEDYKAYATYGAMARIPAALEKQDIFPSKIIYTEGFASTKELFWSPDQDWTAPFKNCDVLIGIIGPAASGSDKLKAIDSQIHRFGERALGALTVCVKKRTLGDFFSKPTSETTFPTSVLRKIKYMKGHRILKNIPIERHLAEANYPDPLIIVGAHALYSTEEESKVQPPAVSALVTSTHSGCPIHFLASSSLEPERLPIKISSLRERIEEQFKVWQNYNPDVTGSPRVIFYRLSNHSGWENDAVYKQEHDEINKAYRSVFKHTPGVPLAYIKVSKTTPETREVSSKSTFTLISGKHIDPYETSDPSGKFQYDVKLDTDVRGPPLGIDKLRDLTIHLNNSAQLDGRPTIALPIHYAQLLNRRVLSYYDSISGQDSTVIPPEASKIPISDSDEVTDKIRLYMGRLWKFDHKSDYIRPETKEKPKNSEALRLERATRPWKPALDNIMFYI